jgi:hypothetical protein
MPAGASLIAVLEDVPVVPFNTVTLLDLTCKHALCHTIFKQPHDRSPQWSSTVAGTVTLVHHTVPEPLSNLITQHQGQHVE